MRTSLAVLALAGALAMTTAVTPALAQARTDVKIGLVLEPPSLDPTAEAAAAVDEVLYSNVFEGLTKFAADGSIVPGLAKSWDISEDGLTYTFHLNEGVTFHDGSAFDAEDVKFSLDRINAEDSLNAQKALYTSIASVEVVDPATVKITLKQPDGNLIYNLAWGDAVIVAPESAENNKTNPIGTGPFSFASRVEGDSITLSKYGAYWGTPVKLEGATFRFIPDPTAAFAALQAGDVDAFPNFPAPETVAQFQNDPRFRVVIGATEGETILAMNNGKAPLDNVKVREAIAHAIDRQAIIDGAMFGYGTPIGTFLSPANPDYVDLTAQSNYDPEKSKALLAEAGVTDLTLSLKLPPVEGYARRGGEIIANQLAAVGIKTEVTNLEWAQWLSEVFTDKNFDLTIISHTEPNDIGIFARPDYYFQYKNADFDKIIAELSVTSDPAKRSELLKAAQKNLADNYAAGFLFELAKVGVENAKLTGLWENAPTQATDLTAVAWEE
ncbi:ABC transporter substrate-binding protein [Devosia sp. ZB163]|uniref:ABC transporter substrate-binding protein n=1 Tax=Devosia sp. ZB163 TaxID=3025938 RepID=UPI00235E1245|nr:ABC transporter substrate-binding protein [Devosia sp. ZB163]MDC9826155.1 ABC transporter substrate-binding protein [Devosia sp. ZB163]